MMTWLWWWYFYKIIISTFHFISFRITHKNININPAHCSNSCLISKLNSGTRRKVSVMKAKTNKPSSSDVYYGPCEMDSHADTIVAGKNCVILEYTGKECNVSPYREDYEAIQNVPIANVATAWQSTVHGDTFILVFNEALWMGDTMETSLINPNQLRHHGVHVQDDPTSRRPMSIITSNGDFAMPLQSRGTTLYFTTHSPTKEELDNCPHIHLSCSEPWDPRNVTFENLTHSLEKEVARIQQQQVGTVHSSLSNGLEGTTNCFKPLELEPPESNVVFALWDMTRKIASMRTRSIPTDEGKLEEQLTRLGDGAGETDVKIVPTFQSKGRHTDVTAEDLSS